MNRSLLLVVCLAALTSSAIAADKKSFPDDYKASPCAPANSCPTFERGNMPSAAFNFLGLQLDRAWIAAHGDEMTTAFEPICRKQATCMATPGNLFAFCNDVISEELRDTCRDRFPRSKDKHEWEQCEAFMETFALGVDQRTQALWLVAQACANEKTPAVDKATPLVWWITPSPIAPDYGGYISINAVDPDTHVPILADISIEGQIIYVPTNPVGSLQTYYPFHWKPKYARVKAANGHSDVVAPNVTIKAPHYPDIHFKMPIEPRKLMIDLVPPARQLHAGKNTLTVVAKDETTGKPVELRVMYGDTPVGTSNEPIELMIDRKGKRREIWVTSLFDQYSDAVVVPAR